MQKSKINKLTTIFFIIVPLIAIIGSVYTLVYQGVYWQTLVFAFVYAILTGVGITAGYHRLFAHKAYRAAWPVRFIFMLLGSAAVQGSVLEWCTDHRNHHRYTDKEGDPYSVTKGFWFAHIGWIFVLDPSKRKFDNVKDLSDDPILRFQHKYFTVIAIFTTLIVPVAIASLWGDPLGGLFIVGALRLTLNHHFTFFINSLCHYWGKLTYERGTARDNWFISLITYGEGFHNFHHKFSVDYRNGIRWYHFDPSKWLIFILAKVGLASNLKRICKDVILQHRLDVEAQELAEITNDTETKQWLTGLLKQIQVLQFKIKELKAEYQELKAGKLVSIATDYKDKIMQYRYQIKLAKKQRREMIKAWETLVNSIKEKQMYPLA